MSASVDDAFYDVLRRRLGEANFRNYIDFERQNHVLRMNYDHPDYGDGANEANKTAEHEEWVRLQIELDRITKPVPHPTKIKGCEGVPFQERPNSVRSTLRRVFAEFKERGVKEFEID